MLLQESIAQNLTLCKPNTEGFHYLYLKLLFEETSLLLQWLNVFFTQYFTRKRKNIYAAKLSKKTTQYKTTFTKSFSEIVRH